MKLCPRCQENKSTSEFWNARHTKDGKQGWCKSCVKERRQQWKKDNPIEDQRHSANAKLKQRFGITLDEYEQTLQRQGGGCAICKRPPGVKRLHVDHCHDTGRVRGILCFPCNVGIGHLQHDPAILRRAARYVA